MSELSGFISQDDEKNFTPICEVGESIMLKGISYLVASHIPLSSGNSQLYKIESLVDGKTYVVKFYTGEALAHKRFPNNEALQRIKQHHHDHIIPLVDFSAPNEIYKSEYFFEITPFLPGGNLLSVSRSSQKYSPDFLKETLIPQLLAGIQAFHQMGLVHCDLKPENILFTDTDQKSIQIGDYGFACLVENLSTATRVSHLVGTEFFQAPEQQDRYVSEKNDFFSLGMILLHLLYPDQLCSDSDSWELDTTKKNQIKANQHSSKNLIHFSPLYENLNTLIKGLTQSNYDQRWGWPEINYWQNKFPVSIEKVEEYYDNRFTVRYRYEERPFPCMLDDFFTNKQNFTSVVNQILDRFEAYIRKNARYSCWD